MSARQVRVTWTATNGQMRVGVPLRVIHPGEVPTVPGVAKHRLKFIAEASPCLRMLVRVVIDGIGDLYYAPHVSSLAEVLIEAQEDDCGDATKHYGGTK